MHDLPFISATDAIGLFRKGELSPVELLDAVLARIDRVEPQVNALTEVMREEAYEAARAAESAYLGKAGREPRALEGVPVAVKEEQPIAGKSLVLGSRLMEGYIADVTHPIIDRILGAGGVIHARTTTPEFSSAAFTHTDVWGLTRNPWNPAFGPGGSSGGSGAALASGETVLATGSDIGGSIRIPAGYCGVVGFKPPFGRVPALPPFNNDAYCHDGPMARTVADCALLENVVAGKHPLDPISMPACAPVSADPGDLSGMRIAWARSLGDIPVEREVADATRAVADRLASLGAVVTEIELPLTQEQLIATVMPHYGAIMGPSVAEVTQGRDDLLMPYVRDFLARSGPSAEGGGFYRGLELEAPLMMMVNAIFQEYDAFVCPTNAGLGLVAGDNYTETTAIVDGQELQHYLMTSLTPLFNVMSRCPVLAVPSGIASNGVPMGVQIVGPTYEDAVPFRIGAALESQMRWWADPTWRPSLVLDGTAS